MTLSTHFTFAKVFLDPLVQYRPSIAVGAFRIFMYTTTTLKRKLINLLIHVGLPEWGNGHCKFNCFVSHTKCIACIALKSQA